MQPVGGLCVRAENDEINSQKSSGESKKRGGGGGGEI
jgi:hypothetical protein